MTRLSEVNLPEDIPHYDYARSAVTSGIVHFGIGNFHRAHQAVYCDSLLAQGDLQWGITGVSLRSASMKDALAPQDYLYTLAVLGTQTDYRIIGAIKDVLVAPQNPQGVIDRLADSQTQLVSSTITEKGYGLTAGAVDFTQPDFSAEASSLAAPKTIYGFIAAGIIARSKKDSRAKLTVMCCDNISGGGEYLKTGVEYLLAQHSLQALEWSQENVGFISSMVDRVCPATDDGLREKVQQDTGCTDSWPVSAEPFSQWIIEGGFAGARPAFDKIGAVFVDDIAPFERMKLSYLNAAHTIASTLGYLSGQTYVHEAIERDELFRFMREALYKNVLPNAAVPKGHDGAAYIEDVIERFQNASLPYANLQVGTDSSQKIQQRWFPTIETALKSKADTSYFEFCLGAWVIFIQTALGNDVLNDPRLGEFKAVQSSAIEELVPAYLEIANAASFAFYKDATFMAAVHKHAAQIKAQGIEPALAAF